MKNKQSCADTFSRFLRFLGCAAVVAPVLACNGGGGGDNPLPGPSLTLVCEAGSVPDPNRIGLECPASAQGTLPVKVVIGGPSTSSDIYGVKFDLVFDGTVLHYATHSAVTSFLAKEGGSVDVLADVSESDPDRLVVAVGLKGPVSGVQVTGSMETVAEFLFQGMAPGTTTIRFENGQVVDSGLNPIASLAFSGQLQIEIP